MRMIIFLLLYYLVWFGCLLSAQHQQPYLAVLVSLLTTAIQARLISRDWRWQSQLKISCITTLVGFSYDSVMASLAMMQFVANPWAPIAPPWILALWLNFGVLLMAMLPMLLSLRAWLIPLAALGFPLAYSAGSGFAVVSFSPLMTTLSLQAGFWALAFPLLITCIKTIRGAN